jgi:hypothetical protein
MVGTPSAEGENEMARYAEALGRRLMIKRIATTLILLFRVASSITYGQVTPESTTSQAPSVPSAQTIKIHIVVRNIPTKDLPSISRARYRFSPFFLRSIRPAQAAGK